MDYVLQEDEIFVVLVISCVLSYYSEERPMDKPKLNHFLIHIQVHINISHFITTFLKAYQVKLFNSTKICTIGLKSTDLKISSSFILS